MEPVTCWKDVFTRWPAEMPRRGVLVATFGEQITFSSFAPSQAFLLIERQSPDTTGARTVILPYDNILGLKIVDVPKGKGFQSLGFEVSAAQR
jgi:hypothetical protein